MTKREERLANGLCVRCGKPPKAGWQMCEQCAQKQREAVRKVQNARRANHRCVQCGGSLRDAEGKIPMRETEDGYKEYVTCAKCREKEKEYDKKRRMARALERNGDDG